MLAPSHAKEIAYPASIFGRMSAERGFGLLQRSADKLDPPLWHEIERFAVRGWGPKPELADYAVDSIGHFRSREDPSRLHVIRVRPLPGYQPVRAVVTVPLDDYLRYACNPFAFARAGFFDFLDAFMPNPHASGFCAPATGPLGTDDAAPPGQARWRDATLAALIGPLLAERSIILGVPGASAASTVVEEIAWAMPIELRSRVTLLSFAYSDADALKGFAPVLACVDDPAGTAPKPDDDHGPADSRGLSAVLGARWARQVAISGPSEDRTTHLHELLSNLERRFDDQKADPAPPVAAAAVDQVEAQAEQPADQLVTPPPEVRGEEDEDDRSKEGLRRWLPLVGGLAVIGIAGIAGYNSLSGSLDGLQRRIGTDQGSGTISARLGAVEQSSGAISERLLALEEFDGTVLQRLATLQESDDPISRRLDTLEAAEGTASGRLAAVEKQWSDLVASLGSDPNPAVVPEWLQRHKASVAELVAAVGLPTDTEPATLLGTVEQLAAVADATRAQVAAATTAFVAAEQALVAPLRALPESGTALGNQVIVTWATEAASGLVTIEARRRLVDPGDTPAARLRIFVDGDAGAAIVVEDRNYGLRLKAADASLPLELTTLRVRVGSVQPEMLAFTVANLPRTDPATGRVVRILGVSPR